MKKKSVFKKTKIPRLSAALLAAIIALFAASACTQPGGGSDPVISISAHPADTTVTEGNISGSLSVSATVTEDAEFAYQWYSNSSASSEGGTLIEGATSASFAIPTALTAGTYYYFCEITAVGAVSIRSNAAKITVASAGTPAITIQSQPADVSVTAGSITQSLSVAASGSGGAEITGYQWYKNGEVSNVGGDKVEGATSASFAIPTDLAEGVHYYFCEIMASGGADALRSNAAKVTVTSTDDDDEVPVYHITTQPKDVTVTRGNISGALTVDAEITHGSTTLSYHWYQADSKNADHGSEIPGATGKSFPIPNDLAVGTYYYFCEVRGGMATATRSDIATVTVINPGTSFYTVGGALMPVLRYDKFETDANTDTTFSAFWDGWKTYQWYVDGVEQTGNGETPNKYIFNEDAGVYEVTLVVNNEAGDAYSGSCRVTVR